MQTSAKRKLSQISSQGSIKKLKNGTAKEDADGFEAEFNFSSQEITEDLSQLSELNNSQKHISAQMLDDSEVERLVKEELKKINDDQEKLSKENKELYNHFNDLQAIASEYSLNFKAPEIVVVGMQSDGKSSFVEALLGFQFNTVETEIGTRRPLILQMINDKNQNSPLCYLYREDLSGIEENPTKVSDIEGEIKKRTIALCGKSKVSSRPIILRVKYKYCSNLTIYDTPGFRKGGNDEVGDRIQRMVMNLIKHKHRLIVCLEQSTVEWCNTQVRPIIAQVDPKHERTIFVTTKFNNRLNQFKDKNDADKFMQANGMPTYFLSLPSGPLARNLSDEDFKTKIEEVFLSDFRLLCKLNIEQENKDKYGFYDVKNHLEKVLNFKYKENINLILEKLKSSTNEAKLRVAHIDQELKNSGNEDVNESSIKYTTNYCNLVATALTGTTLFDALSNGFTLEEEKKASGISDWKNFKGAIPIRNEKYKLYGGSQIERLLNEFEIVAHSQEFPPTSNDEVAVTIGLSSLHSTPDYDRGASDLAQKKCNAIFTPLIDTLLSRSKFIMTSVFKLVADHCTKENPNSSCSKFFDELRNISEKFIGQVLKEVRLRAFEEFDTFTKIMDWDVIQSSQQNLNYDLLNPSPEDTEKRVKELTSESGSKVETFSSRSRDLDDEKCNQIKIVAAKLFAGVRLLFVKYIRAKYNAFFLSPIFTKLDGFIKQYFKTLSDDDLRELLGNDAKNLKKEKEISIAKIEKLRIQIVKFEILSKNLVVKE
eukprot:gene8021-12486_t